MDFRVVIPEEVFAVLSWQDEGLPAICVVNQALADFEPKVVFDWHLSIIINCVNVAEKGMPTPAERQALDEFGDGLDRHLKAGGNALFLARITWNVTRQLLYRVCDPGVANRYLTSVIEGERQAREFDFRMERDSDWEFAAYYLRSAKADGA